jgi:hypothetical protein
MPPITLADYAKDSSIEFSWSQSSPVGGDKGSAEDKASDATGKKPAKQSKPGDGGKGSGK